MEKYGVEESEDIKTAQEGSDVCPVCGRKLEPVNTTGVRLCRNCGTKPFEQPSK